MNPNSPTVIPDAPTWGDHLDAPYGVRIIELTQDEITLVSEQDHNVVNSKRWHFARHRKGTGYAARAVYSGKRKKTVRMQQTIVKASDGEVVDHKNRRTLDNRRCNLRSVSYSLNVHNKPVLSVSGYRGVFRFAGKWRAAIQHKYKMFNLGTFATCEEAAHAYDKKAKEFYGDDACVNF